ncbi:MAG: PAS domain S-box protein [Vicinamibacterales bacterium]
MSDRTPSAGIAAASPDDLDAVLRLSPAGLARLDAAAGVTWATPRFVALAWAGERPPEPLVALPADIAAALAAAREHPGGTVIARPPAALLLQARAAGDGTTVLTLLDVSHLAGSGIPAAELERAQGLVQAGSWHLDLGRDVLTWSAETFRIFGVSGGRPLTYDEFLAYVHPDDRAAVDDAWQAAMAGTPYDVEHRLIVDGTVRWVRERARLELDADGRPAAGIGTVQDITDRKLAEIQLRDRKTELQMAQRLANLGHWQLDVETGEYTWTDEIFRLLGVEPGPFAPTFNDHFLPAVHPDDRAEVATRGQEALASGSAAIEFRVVRPDGSERRIFSYGEARPGADGRPRIFGIAQDVTDRARAEAAVAESQRTLRALIDALPVFVATVDLDGRVGDTNRAPLEVGGVAREDVIGRPFAETPFWSHSPAMQAAVRDALVRAGSGELVRGDLTALAAGGTVLDVDVTWAPLRDADGRITGVVASAIDITERRRAEDALRTSEQTLRRFYDMPFIGMAVTSPGTRHWLQVNQTLCDLLGYPREELLEKSWAELTHPDDIEADVANFERVMRGETEGYKMDKRFIRRDGQVITATIDVKCVRDGRGAVDFFVATIADISDRQRREDELVRARQRAEIFEQLVGAAGQGIGLAAPDGRVDYMNAALLRLLEIPSIAEARRQTIDAFYEPDALRRLHDEALPAVATRGSWSGELPLRGLAGQTTPTLHNIFPIRDEAGTTVALANLVVDLSERLAAEADRARLEERMRQSQKLEAIGTLAGGIAHDFNNLLFAMTGSAEMARAKAASGRDADEDFERLLQAAERARDLIQQILTFSRPQERPREAVDLAPVVKEAVRLLRATLPASARLDTDIWGSLPAVNADTSEIHQVVVNLGTNAWHALGDRPGTITVSLQDIDVSPELSRISPDLSPGPYVRLTVRDTGSGMPPETAARVFEPFFTTKAPGHGTGLGLSVVHGIVRGLGGATTVSSRVGAGTTFHVYLPVSRSTPAGPRRGPAEGAPGAGQRIVVVDDDPQLVAITTGILTEAGYEVVGLSDPEEALARIANDPAIAAVITDLNMPQVLGLDLVGQVREVRPGLPVAVLSGFFSAEQAERARALGVTERLDKPISAAALRGAVARLVAGGPR